MKLDNNPLIKAAEQLARVDIKTDLLFSKYTELEKRLEEMEKGQILNSTADTLFTYQQAAKHTKRSIQTLRNDKVKGLLKSAPESTFRKTLFTAQELEKYLLNMKKKVY